MIFGWLRKKKKKKYDWSSFAIRGEKPVEFLADFTLGVLTLASLEYGVTKIDSGVLNRALCKLIPEFQIPETLISNDNCGYSSSPIIGTVLIPRALALLDPPCQCGVPNVYCQKNLWHLRKRGPGFIRALYPVVDRFVELVTRH